MFVFKMDYFIKCTHYCFSNDSIITMHPFWLKIVYQETKKLKVRGNLRNDLLWHKYLEWQLHFTCVPAMCCESLQCWVETRWSIKFSIPWKEWGWMVHSRSFSLTNMDVKLTHTWESWLHKVSYASWSTEVHFRKAHNPP